MSDRSAIDVLIICALKEELDALLEVERERSDGWTREPGNPPYWTATFNGDAGPIRVAAASLTEMGTAATVDVTVTLRDRLQPSCLAMCGVCAGHPDDTDLGDVIIAERVFQHDNGKLTDKGFQADIWTRNANRAWRRLAQELAGSAIGRHGFAAVDPDSDAGKWWLLERLRTGRKPLAPALSRYVPDARRDHFLESLLESGLVCWTAEGPTLTATGREAAERRRFIHSAPATSLPYHIHLGPIGSGNYVVADGGIWERLKGGGRKTIGVEMEAAALGAVAEGRERRFLVVKGVMDHGDSHKSDRFKNFAARASAEVLCEFLRRVIEPGTPTVAPPDPEAIFEGPTPDPRFTGRAKELAKLKQLIQANRTVCVVAAGIGGIGKTTLVAEFAAKRARDLYPDGIAWIDGSPEQLIRELARVANRFGWRDQHDRDATPDEAVRWLKSALAPRRALVVVDNFDPEHSNPDHLPIPGGDSRTIVTSRTLTLDVTLNVKRLPLGVWSLETCRAYLRKHCLDCHGVKNASDEQLDLFATFVGQLPLGMRLLLSVLRNRPGTPLTDILRELREQPLGTLDKYEAKGVAATFTVGYQHLKDSDRLVLQALAACAKQTRAEIVAAVAELSDIPDVRAALDYLHTHGFAELHEDGRWGMHDVVRMFVLAQPGAEEFAARQLAWVYRHLRAHADPTAYRRFAEGVEEAKHTFTHLLLHNVGAAAAVCALMQHHLLQVGRYPDLIALSKALLDAASPDSEGLDAALKDSEAALALNNLGLCYQTLGDVAKAIEYHERALTIDEKLGHLGRQATDLGNLGLCYETLGEVAKAIEYHERALAIDEKLGALGGQANHLGNLGICYQRLDEAGKAIGYHERALAIDEKLGRLEGQANQLGNLGTCYLTLGKLARAIEYLERSFAIDEQLGRLEGQANQLANLGICYLTLGKLAKAIEYLERSLAIDEKLGRLEGQASNLGNLGLCYRTLGDISKAIDHHERSLAIEQQLGRLEGQANQLANLAFCCEELGDAERARGLLNRASDLYRRMALPDDHPSVARVQRALDRLA